MEHFSVPAGDSFIYLVDFGEEILAGEQFPSPPGTFLLSIRMGEAEQSRRLCFRPHRGLFFYLSCPWNPLILQVPFYSLRRKTLDRIFFYGNYLKNAFKVSFYLMRRKLPRNHLYSPHSHIIQLISISGTFTHMRRKTF